MKEGASQIWRDLGFAIRLFGKRPALTAVAVLTLALGIGATTAVFSIVEAVLLRPLPYRDPSQLVAVWVTSTRERQALAKLFPVYQDYVEFRRHANSFESVAAATWAQDAGRVLTGHGPARSVLTIPATASFFDTLGASAALGRTFRSDDENRGCSVVLTSQFWRSTLGADPGIVGRSLVLDQKPCTVLGVMPEQFSFYPTQTQMWILLGPHFQPNQNKTLFVGIFARLKKGVTLDEAHAELRSLFRAIHTGPETRDFEPVVYDLHGEFTFLAGRNLRVTLLLVFAAVSFVMLIACLNVANLLMGRFSERRRELAVRAALGSGQARLVRQLITEGLALAGMGAAFGLGFAFAAIRYFRLADPIELSVGAGVTVNLPVLAFSVAAAAAATLLFGLLPALRASRVDLTRDLKTAGRGAIRGRPSLAKTLIAVEMALSFLLLIGAGLLLTSALRMGSEHLGFSPNRIVTAAVRPPAFRYSTEVQRTQVYDGLLDRLTRLPGIEAVAFTSSVPPSGGGNQVLSVRGRSVPAGEETHDMGGAAVSPRFFDVLRIPILRGRSFTAFDRDHTDPVAVVNEALAQKYFPNEDPLGQQIRIPGGTMPWLTIVGVVGNVKHTELMNEMKWVETPVFYRPLAQEARPAVSIVARMEGDAGRVGREIQREIASIDESIPLGEITPLAASLSKALAYPRFRAVVLAFFALAAVLLSAVGLHGVLSQLVAQRAPELGLRRAVGAQTYDLLWLIACQGGGPVLAGLGAGILLTIGASRALSSFLYGIQPADPRTLLLTITVLIGAAVSAMLFPAIRAARVDPMTALRED